MSKNNKKLEWQLVSQKGVNFENLLISLMARGYIDLSKKKINKFGPTYATGYRQIDAHRDILKKDCGRFLKRAKILERKKPGSILKSYQDYDKLMVRVEKFADSFFKKDFSKYQNFKLADLFERFAEIAGLTAWYAYNYYFYQYLGDDFYEILKQKEKDIGRQAEIFEILTQGTEFSVMQKEQKDLLLLTKKIKSQKLPLSGNEVKNLINRHIAKYSYTGFHYFRGDFYSYDYFIKRIKQRLQIDFESQLEKILRLEKDNKNWLTLAKKINLSQKEIILAKTLKQMAYCTNRFDEVSNYLYSSAQGLLKEVSVRLGITYKELIEMEKMEIIGALKENKKLKADFRKLLKERIRDSALIMIGGEVEILSSQKLLAYKKQELKSEISYLNIKQLKGQPASAGRAIGRAVLVFSIGDLGKVKKGDVMIAKSTVPSFVPAMEKASAVIAEVGGLLSHAAIVSRELGKPCIVGVNRATEVLKDGDLVEVDATKGVVKKL